MLLPQVPIKITNGELRACLCENQNSGVCLRNHYTARLCGCHHERRSGYRWWQAIACPAYLQRRQVMATISWLGRQVWLLEVVYHWYHMTGPASRYAVLLICILPPFKPGDKASQTWTVYATHNQMTIVWTSLYSVQVSIILKDSGCHIQSNEAVTTQEQRYGVHGAGVLEPPIMCKLIVFMITIEGLGTRVG